MTREPMFAPFSAEGDWHHVLARYVACAAWVKGARVLDLTCGRGVGCQVLHELGAARVLGLDPRDEVINWATSRFGAPTVQFQTWPWGGGLPVEDHSFDVVVALNPAHRLGREEYRDVLRVLAEGGLVVVAPGRLPPISIGALLPFYDRSPAVGVAGSTEEAVLTELLGRPVVMRETPVLGFHFGGNEDASKPAAWSSPNELLTRSSARIHDPERRLLIFRPDAPGQVNAPESTVGLPYVEVVSQLGRTLAESTRQVEVLQLNLSMIEGHLTDKEQLLADLEFEVHALRQHLANVTDQWQRQRTHGFTREEAPTNPTLRAPEPRADSTYVQELWESLEGWQRYARQLEEEAFQLRTQLEHTHAELSQVSAAVPQAPPIPEPTEREAELSRHIVTLEEELGQLQEQLDSAQVDLNSSREGMRRAEHEVGERQQLIETLKRRLEDSQTTLDRFTEEVQDTLEQRNQLQRELAAAQSELDQSTVKTAKSDETTISLEREIRDRAARIQTLEREQMGLKVEMSALQRENTRLAAAKSVLDRQLAEHKKAVAVTPAPAQSSSAPASDAAPPLDETPGEKAETAAAPETPESAKPSRSRSKSQASTEETPETPKTPKPRRSRSKSKKSTEETPETPKTAKPRRSRSKSKKSTEETPETPKTTKPRRSRSKSKKSTTASAAAKDEVTPDPKKPPPGGGKDESATDAGSKAAPARKPRRSRSRKKPAVADSSSESSAEASAEDSSSSS